jgi:hypothetical protein
MERFIVLPFSIACASHSSVDVASSESCKKPKPETKSHATSISLLPFSQVWNPFS